MRPDLTQSNDMVSFCDPPGAAKNSMKAGAFYAPAFMMNGSLVVVLLPFNRSAFLHHPLIFSMLTCNKVIEVIVDGLHFTAI